MIAVAAVALLFIALGLAGVRWGADSREAREWQPVQAPTLEWRAGSTCRP